jgi:hypothetical protein
MRPHRQRNGSRVIVSPPREIEGGIFYVRPQIGWLRGGATFSCGVEVEIRCQRANGLDRIFSTSMDWLCAERLSESTLAYSAETLLFNIIARCLRYIGEPVDVRAGLLSKRHVWAIISSVDREMTEIKNENELWRGATIVTQAAHLGLAPQPSDFGRGTWIARCPGANHILELQPKQNLFYCRCCRVGGGIDKLVEFVARKRSTAEGFTERRTLH